MHTEGLMTRFKLGLRLTLFSLLAYAVMWALGAWFTPKEGTVPVWAWASGASVALFLISTTLLTWRFYWNFNLGISFVLAGLLSLALNAVAIDSVSSAFGVAAGFSLALGGILIIGVPFIRYIVMPITRAAKGRSS